MTPYFLQAHQAFCRTGGSLCLSLVHLRKQEKVKKSCKVAPVCLRGVEGSLVCCSWPREPEVGLASAPRRWPQLGEGLVCREMVFQRKGFGEKIERNVNRGGRGRV